jgi:hypothetical protein
MGAALGVAGSVTGADAHPAHRLDELLPWNWHPATPAVSRAA